MSNQASVTLSTEEFAALARDANRYRVLRECALTASIYDYSSEHKSIVLAQGEKLDKSVDDWMVKGKVMKPQHDGHYKSDDGWQMSRVNETWELLDPYGNRVAKNQHRRDLAEYYGLKLMTYEWEV